jgi:hypothetical protein
MRTDLILVILVTFVGDILIGNGKHVIMKMKQAQNSPVI